MASRRLQAKPEEALAPNRPAKMPAARLIRASTSISPPYRYTWPMSPASMPLSMMEAVTKGMSTSISTSSPVNRGVSREAALYSFTCCSSVFIIVVPP